MCADWSKTDDDGESSHTSISTKKNNVLPLWGNERTMNLNPLILTNIQSSHYFKVNLYELKTYHEVIDEIYNKVQHLEPWEKGSRKTSGQTGMCGGVRGVGAGGIVSTAYCLLYKLFTLKMTRKQLNGLINHSDSPYIRSLGFMYIRYTQPPADLWEWYEDYLEDEEEVDVKAGGGQTMTIGNILRSFLTKLEWFSTLFPRIPVPIQQKIEKQMNNKFPSYSQTGSGNYNYKKPTNTSSTSNDAKHIPDNEAYYGEAERHARSSKDKNVYVSYQKYNERDGGRGGNGGDYKRNYYNNDRDDREYKNYTSLSPDRKKYKNDDGYSRNKYDNSRSKYDTSRNDKYDNRSNKYDTSRNDKYDNRSNKYDTSRNDKYDNRSNKYDTNRSDKYDNRSNKYSKDDYYRDTKSTNKYEYSKSSRDEYSRSSRDEYSRSKDKYEGSSSSGSRSEKYKEKSKKYESDSDSDN